MRLIDADALKRDLKSVTLSNGTLVNANTILALLDKYPTAYDTEKVVEQLKELHEGYECTDNEFQRGAKAGAHYVLNRAIEIVKGGGVDGNNRKDCMR